MRKILNDDLRSDSDRHKLKKHVIHAIRLSTPPSVIKCTFDF